MTDFIIRDLFSSRIDRKIEEVIKVDQNEEIIVLQEIEEYILTDSIEQNMIRVLDGYRQSVNQPNEAIAIWVAGFFGAGKSSFAKYLGLAISNRDLKGNSAGDLLSQRATNLKIKGLLKVINEQIPTEAIIFDVSADRNVNSSEALTKIFYRKVLNHLGYSSSLEVAELEIELEEQGRIDNFLETFSHLYPEEDWRIAKTRLIQAMPRASAVMNILEPQTYQDKDSWLKSARNENVPITPALLATRTIKLMERKYPGKQLIFVVDEVGQFVARDIQKMLDLQAIVQQFGVIGRGKVWVMVTSQEKLSDVVNFLDDNRTELARLQDRFPYKPVLEPSDIAEVTSRRVLGKNSSGENQLQNLFEKFQGRLVSNTKIETKVRFPDFTKKSFVDLYPLLPYQIELIIQIVSGLRLSGGASRQFGGANRAIIKLAQELLTNPQTGLANEFIGSLVTLDQVYDLQINNIDSQYRSKIIDIKNKATHPLSEKVAKAICLLQFVDQVPVTENNIAVVLHPRVDSDSLESEVHDACIHMIERNLIRKADGQYRIPKPEEDDWEKVRSQQSLSAIDRNNLIQQALLSNWEPVPRAALAKGVKIFKAGLHFRGSEIVKGDVIVKVERIDSSEKYDERVEQLRQQSQRDINNFFWAMRPNTELDRALSEWFRSQKVIDLRGHDATQKGQLQLVSEERRKLDRFRQDACDMVDKALISGKLLFNGGPCTIVSNTSKAIEAIRDPLSNGLIQIYERFEEAAVNPSENELNQLLSSNNLKGLTGSIEILGLCISESSQWVIDKNHPALMAILNRLKSKGGQSGKEIADYFANAPYGWSLDAVKYLIASLQVGFYIKATHNSKSYVGTENPLVRPLFTNNNTFRTTSFNHYEVSLGPQSIIEACQTFQQFAGKTIQGISPGPLAREIRASCVVVNADLNQASKTLLPLNLPGREDLDQAAERLSSWQDSNDEEVVKAFLATANNVKDQWQKAIAINTILATRKDDLRRASRAIGDHIWGHIQKEENLSHELIDVHNKLKDLLQTKSFYERLPEIVSLTEKLEDAYKERYSQVLQSLNNKVQKLISKFEQAPYFKRLDNDKKHLLKESILQKLNECNDYDLSRLRDQPAVIEGVVREQELKAQSWAFPEEQICKVIVSEICNEPFDSDGLESMLDRIRLRCEKELGNDRKVLLQ